MIDGVAWQLDTKTGQYWPVVSETDTSVDEVEREVGDVGDDLKTAHELIRTEVCSTCFFYVTLSNVHGQESQQPHDPPNNSGPQSTGESSSTHQRQVQTLHESSSVPGQGVSTPEEHPQGPPEPQETHVIPSTTTRPHTPSAPLDISPATQTSSDWGLNIIGNGANRESMLDDRPTPTWDSSVTPTPGNPYNSSAALDSAAQLLRGLWGRVVGSSQRRKRNRIGLELDEESGSNAGCGGAGVHTPLLEDPQSREAGTSRHGKQRRVELYSDEETGTGGGDEGDVLMEASPNHTQNQQQPREVHFISIPTVSSTHLPEESTCN